MVQKTERGYPFGNERQFHNPDLMQTFEVHWSHPKSVDRWLEGQLIGTSLNVCKGKSTVGDITIDIVRDLSPCIVADLFHLPFPNKSFDTVICDPPFDYYGSLKWIHELRRVANRRIILASNLRRIGIGDCWTPEFFRLQTQGNNDDEVLAGVHVSTSNIVQSEADETLLNGGC